MVAVFQPTIGACYGLVLFFHSNRNNKSNIKEMRTYIFYITSKESKRQRIIQIVSESLALAEKEVIEQMYHYEEISGFAYF